MTRQPISRALLSVRLDERGFTLIELLVSVVVVGLIMAGILQVLMTGSQAHRLVSDNIESQGGARYALYRMAREIRGAGYNPQPTVLTCPPNANCPLVGPPPGFGSPTSTGFTIQNDNSGDGAIAVTERIAYTLNGTDFQRQDFSVDLAPQTVVGGVQALVITYWGESGNQLASPVDVTLIRSIEIAITARPETQTATSTAVTMTDRIRIRNR